jgi:hypothetical protein
MPHCPSVFKMGLAYNNYVGKTNQKIVTDIPSFPLMDLYARKNSHRMHLYDIEQWVNDTC